MVCIKNTTSPHQASGLSSRKKTSTGSTKTLMLQTAVITMSLQPKHSNPPVLESCTQVKAESLSSLGHLALWVSSLVCLSLLSLLTTIIHRSPKKGNTMSPSMIIMEEAKLAAGPPLCHGPYYVPRSNNGHKQAIEIYTSPLIAM